MSRRPKCELVAAGNDWAVTVDGNLIAERGADSKKWYIKKACYDVRSNGLHETKVYFNGKCIGTAKITSQLKRSKV
jgi:hypothetical protein